jgi:hypothetical protein
MDVQLFRQVLENVPRRELSVSEGREERGLRIRQLIAAASPEHVPEYFCRGGFSDYYRCSCGWISNGYWDLESAAWDEWIKHVKEEMGLGPLKCPCGQTYTPADGETACHQLVDND